MDMLRTSELSEIYLKQVANTENMQERADTWHPDPEEDRKLGGPGANQRDREDRAAASKPAAKKEDPKKLRKVSPTWTMLSVRKVVQVSLQHLRKNLYLVV